MYFTLVMDIMFFSRSCSPWSRSRPVPSHCHTKYAFGAVWKQFTNKKLSSLKTGATPNPHGKGKRHMAMMPPPPRQAQDINCLDS
ncbi:hypothetical protein QVD17_09570 [Tagetes erecta]|uniref:Uncharacterized protein n=1 Tax=Tagetes erecta TaxID=13708 RepID=A0AAD8L686_TARER|nr:hypothetical protein QVD17_09570 [Tagetes erecta]